MPNPHTKGDLGLADRFLIGDNEVYATVKAWCSQVIQCTSWRREFDADDVLQETLLAVLNNLKNRRYRGEGFKAYVERICKCRCVDALRRNYRNNEVSEVDIDFIESEELGPEQSLEKKQRIEVVRMILDKLNSDCRQLVIWIHHDRIGAEEAARRLGKTVGATRKQLHGCMKRVRELLHQHEKHDNESLRAATKRNRGINGQS